VPFSLRITYSCLPQFLGRHHETINRLLHVRGQVNKILHHLQNGLSENGSTLVISEDSRAGTVKLIPNDHARESTKPVFSRRWSFPEGSNFCGSSASINAPHSPQGPLGRILLS